MTTGRILHDRIFVHEALANHDQAISDRQDHASDQNERGLRDPLEQNDDPARGSIQGLHEAIRANGETGRSGPAPALHVA